MGQARLGALETQVMKAVWRLGRGSVREVLEALPHARAYTTVLTTLRNLEVKGYLRHEVDGRRHVYVPLVRAHTVGKRALRDLVDRLFDGSRVKLVAALFDEEGITDEELAALRREVADVARKEEESDE